MTKKDHCATGARLAAKGAGKLDQVKILGTDGLPGPAGGIRAVAEGEWAATFTYRTGGDRYGEVDPARLCRQGADRGRGLSSTVPAARRGKDETFWWPDEASRKQTRLSLPPGC
ncbi:hypothetical protein NLM31_34650 [Bradyrhizobium sp. CCGUVB4N]|uniref:hypothetical protein n=1 Tax=Bradyrhizobium sp. CCGUVB4N TaxID=2949631 RepID=UPI0020B43814|nr:hypothetical protein [Bradyrhizobium sp. CCGUVB4N]MCP3385535.1 hypothetical protein [Bradyrhizobium sp. CCGUVB4N]